MVDNCSIHTQGDNTGLQETLFLDHGILMISLPPYHPDLNPTELVFNTLLQILVQDHARFNSNCSAIFKECIEIAMISILRKDVKIFYKKCGYRTVN